MATPNAQCITIDQLIMQLQNIRQQSGNIVVTIKDEDMGVYPVGFGPYVVSNVKFNVNGYYEDGGADNICVLELN